MINNLCGCTKLQFCFQGVLLVIWSQGILTLVLGPFGTLSISGYFFIWTKKIVVSSLVQEQLQWLWQLAWLALFSCGFLQEAPPNGHLKNGSMQGTRRNRNHFYVKESKPEKWFSPGSVSQSTKRSERRSTSSRSVAFLKWGQGQCISLHLTHVAIAFRIESQALCWRLF